MANITNSLPGQPAVKIFVDGLFILCIDDATRIAQLGVYEYSNDHNFFIRISRKRRGDADNSTTGRGGELIRKLDDENEIKSGDISITITNRQPGVMVYQNPDFTEDIFTTDPRDTNSDVAQNPGKFEPDFRWIINPEGPRFYDRPLKLVPGVIERKIVLEQGVIYTESFAARKISRTYETAARLAGFSDLLRFYFVTAQLGLAIAGLDSNERLNISYTDNNVPQVISLDPPGTDFYYELFINNNCPDSAAEGKVRQSDFQHYYNAIDVPVAERLEESIVSGTGSNKFPCDLIYLEHTPHF